MYRIRWQILNPLTKGEIGTTRCISLNVYLFSFYFGLMDEELGVEGLGTQTNVEFLIHSTNNTQRR
jgi:hypothetical protein